MNKTLPNNLIFSQNSIARPKESFGGSVSASKIFNPTTEKIQFYNQVLSSNPGKILIHLRNVFLKSEEFIYQSGDNITDVYFPENAVISEYQMLDDGRTSEVAMIGREGITGLEVVLNSATASHWSKVSIAGNAYKIKSEIFKKEFDDNIVFREIVLNYLHYYLEQTSQKIICNSYHLIEKRLCSWLLMLNDRNEKNKINVTHEQLAQFLGVQRPSISRIALKLKKKNIISYERGEIHISNRKALENAACCCYKFLHFPSTDSSY